MPFLLAHIAQILVAALGGLLFDRLGVPAAWLSGAVIATVLWGFTGWGVALPPALRDAAMLISGATVGAAVTPEALSSIERYPWSLVALIAGVAAISTASALWLTRISGWRRDDALLASVPGALSTVLAVAADRNAAVASIAIVQSLRLFVLVMLLPSAVVLLGGGSGAAGIARMQPAATPVALAAILAGGLAAGSLFERLRVAAPVLLGATLVSTGLHVADLATGAIPPIIATVGLVLMGIFVAERFRSLDGAFLRKTIPAALGSFVISLGVAAFFSGIAASLAEVSYADALVAFAPGGLEAMMILALLLGLDPLYVGVHHLARFLGIGLVIPFLIAWLQRGDPPEA
jgi:membrane AbrB-like protein